MNMQPAVHVLYSIHLAAHPIPLYPLSGLYIGFASYSGLIPRERGHQRLYAEGGQNSFTLSRVFDDL